MSWRLSITMEAAFCIEAIEEALVRYGKPEIFNTDQGSQFTSVDFTAVLKRPRSTSRWTARGGTIHRAALAFDQIRGGLSHAYKTVSEASTGIGCYLTFYNCRRPHSSLDRQTADPPYFNTLTPVIAAAQSRRKSILAKTH